MPPVDPLAAIKAALHRWHLGRVLVHQFWLMAQRRKPEPEPVRRSTGGGSGRWQRVRVADRVEPGLVAFKHAQQQEQRAAMERSFRAAEHMADDRMKPPDDTGGSARGSGHGRAAQARRLRK